MKSEIEGEDRYKPKAIVFVFLTCGLPNPYKMHTKVSLRI